MGDAWLNVAMVMPKPTSMSGGADRILALISNSAAARLTYTVYFVGSDRLDRTFAAELTALQRKGRVEIAPTGAVSSQSEAPQHDAVVIPSEGWSPPLDFIKKAGIRGPRRIEFQLLPFLGTTDSLRLPGIRDLALPRIAKLGVASHRVCGDGYLAAAGRVLASAASIRRLQWVRDCRVMAVTQPLANDMALMGFRKPLYIPDCPYGVDPPSIREARGLEVPLKYDALYVGRIHPTKGILDLPEIVARIKQLLGRGLRVGVCGPDVKDRYTAAFSERSQLLGVDRDIQMLGWKSKRELYPLMRMAGVLIYPSYVDSFSITVLESLCLELPVAAYATDVMAHIWSGRDGVELADLGDKDGLARAAVAASERKKSTGGSSRLAEDATRIAARYTWAQVVRDERRFYEWQGTAGDQ